VREVGGERQTQGETRRIAGAADGGDAAAMQFDDTFASIIPTLR
jgi:hypothetical protein